MVITQPSLNIQRDKVQDTTVNYDRESHIMFLIWGNGLLPMKMGSSMFLEASLIHTSLGHICHRLVSLPLILAS
jgi:hypothetical protein